MKRKNTHLSHALFPKVRQLVLGLLYTQCNRSFYTNEIIRLTHAGSGAVQRELTKLSALGLITVESFGNQRHYQANQSSPLFAEMRGIILKTFGLADIVHEALMPITDDIQFAFIYGSMASRKDNATSDIDLMIISDTLSYAELFSLLEKPQEKLGRKINPTFYSAKEWVKKRNAKNNFVTQVIKHPKIFLLGTIDELKELG